MLPPTFNGALKKTKSLTQEPFWDGPNPKQQQTESSLTVELFVVIFKVVMIYQISDSVLWKIHGGGEMAQQLWACATLAQVLSLITCITSRFSQPLVTSALGYLMPLNFQVPMLTCICLVSKTYSLGRRSFSTLQTHVLPWYFLLGKAVPKQALVCLGISLWCPWGLGRWTIILSFI